MTEQPDTAAIRAGIFGNPAKVIYDLCDALDAARTESEARRREQIYAVRLAEAAEARIAAALAILRQFGFTDTEMAIIALTEGTVQ